MIIGRDEWHRGHEGQALPLGLALLLLAVVTGLMLYDTGRAAVTRTHLANAADAAAHGGLQWQARALNFTAYANRAMVANQVSIAQAVSLRSWSTYARMTAENVQSVAAPVPYLGALSQAAQATLQRLERVIDPLSAWMITTADNVNAALSIAQEAMFNAALSKTPQVVRQVVQANDARFHVDSALALASQRANLAQFDGLLQRRTTADIDAARERVAIIEASMDDFSRQRDWRLFERWFPLTPLSQVRLHREGETRLLTEETSTGLALEWKARDTLSLNSRVLTPAGWQRTELPIGWSETIASAGSNDESKDLCNEDHDATNALLTNCDSWFDYNAAAEALASRGVPALSGHQSSRSIVRYSGLQAFHTLADAHHANADPRLELLVEVSASPDYHASGAARVSGDRLQSTDDPERHPASALSLAEVFYQRADTEPFTSLEPANVYNPYWSVRLKSVPDSARLDAVAGRQAGHTR